MPSRSPIFIVSPPGSGSEILARSLTHAIGVTRASDDFLDALEATDPARRSWHSHGLGADDAPAIADAARAALLDALEPEDDMQSAEDTRALTAGALLALRVPFLNAVFPDSRFVLMLHEPRQTIQNMLDAWRAGASISCPELPGWSGPAWSLPLVPAWQELSGLPLEAVVAEQWRRILDKALDDLEALPPDRWAVCELNALLDDPRRECKRLCASLELRYDQALLGPPETARRVRLANPPPPPATPELEAELGRLQATEHRLRELIAVPPPPPPAPPVPPAVSGGGAAGGPDASPFRSVSTGSFSGALRALNASLLVSTYQAGRLVCARDTGTLLNTHFRQFDKPMGIAVADGRIALGTRTEIFDFRNMPELAPKIDPPGTHDSCYLPRNRHVTGDILVHELAYAAGELWGVATAFSCLATFDADHSFVPRWAPPFISALTTGDRCHLNGLAVVDDRPAFVTALGQTDEPGAWRAGKAGGGCLISVDSSEVVLTGLSMPHSPRWHEGRLWLLESGRGALVTVDLASGRTETVAELPGFTRGMAIAGGAAFVGLSQIRESSTFGDLPLTNRLQERVCGVWVVDLVTGETLGFLRFEDLVQEVFEVALLPGARYPEIAEPDSTATASAFQLP